MQKNVVTKQKDLHLYETVADNIIRLIDNRTFRPGDRIPSISELSRQNQVSINTIKVAYSYLEDRCLIEARPQSGYYVCAKLPKPPKDPDISKHTISPFEISSSELVVRIMRNVLDDRHVQFGAAIPDPQLVPAEKLTRIQASACRRFKYESAAYSMPPGNKRLRAQIAQKMLKAGCILHPDQIMITSGASEAVLLALRVLCKPGDTIAVGSPIYFNFIQMFEQLDLRVIEIPVSPRDGIHLGILEQALKNNTMSCCLVIPNFDNPMGSCLTDENKDKLLQLTKRYQVPVIEDDINGDLAFSDNRPTVIKSWDTSGDVLLCSSFSKTLAPGYRIGWIAPGKYMEKILHLKIVSNIATASPTQLAICEFLENGGYEHHLRHIRKQYAKKVAKMGEAIGSYFPSETRVTRPKGGFSLWVELPEHINTLTLYGRAEQKGITIAPGSLFSTRGKKYSNCLRLNGACWSEENRSALKLLGDLTIELAQEFHQSKHSDYM